MTLYLIAFFAPSVYLVLYVASVLRKKWRSHVSQKTAIIPEETAEAAGVG